MSERLQVLQYYFLIISIPEIKLITILLTSLFYLYFYPMRKCNILRGQRHSLTARATKIHPFPFIVADSEGETIDTHVKIAM